MICLCCNCICCCWGCCCCCICICTCCCSCCCVIICGWFVGVITVLPWFIIVAFVVFCKLGVAVDIGWFIITWCCTGRGTWVTIICWPCWVAIITFCGVPVACPPLVNCSWAPPGWIVCPDGACCCNIKIVFVGATPCCCDVCVTNTVWCWFMFGCWATKYVCPWLFVASMYCVCGCCCMTGCKICCPTWPIWFCIW